MRTSKASKSAAMAWLTVVAAACGIDPVGADAPMPDDAVALHAEEIVSVQAAWSGFESATRSVITDDEAWAAAWQTLYANQSPVPERPDIDFRTHVILLAAMGTRPTTGYSITIDSVHHHQGVLYVSVMERSPGPSCGTGQALTAPVHVVQVPREGTTARFDVTTETFSCL